MRNRTAPRMTGQRSAARRRALAPACIIIALCGAAGTTQAQLQEQNVLLVYNSLRADSLAVRNLYIAARPGVHQFDLATSAIGTASVSRQQYVDHIRTPIKEFINGVHTGNDLSQQIMAIALTRGIPTQIVGTNEFNPTSSWSSVDSDLTLLQQDLEAAGTGSLPFRYNGIVDNPYHQRINQPITGFSRANVQTQRSWAFQAGPSWVVSGLTPGDMYLVCRLDSAPTDVGTPEEITSLEHIARLIERSQNLIVPRCGVQSLLDEYDGPNELDDDSFGPNFPGRQDFENTASILGVNGFTVLHDKTTDFIEGHELPDQIRPVLVLGTYGENHKIVPGNEDPPGDGVYVFTYNLHPAAMFVSYESFNGNSIITGGQRSDHQQVLDFIGHGGSFTIAQIREPFTFAVADLEYLTQNMLLHGMTYAEAAYSAIPGISWQLVAVGDPLARIAVVDEDVMDLNGDGAVDIEDLYVLAVSPVDVTCDSVFNHDDPQTLRNRVRTGELADMAN